MRCDQSSSWYFSDIHVAHKTSFVEITFAMHEFTRGLAIRSCCWFHISQREILQNIFYFSPLFLFLTQFKWPLSFNLMAVFVHRQPFLDISGRCRICEFRRLRLQQWRPPLQRFQAPLPLPLPGLARRVRVQQEPVRAAQQTTSSSPCLCYGKLNAGTRCSYGKPCGWKKSENSAHTHLSFCHYFMMFIAWCSLLVFNYDTLLRRLTQMKYCGFFSFSPAVCNKIS